MKKICWNVTSICNKKCKYCFRCNDEHDLSFDENVNILYKLKKMHIEKINWSGGEPTLYPKIKELFEISKKLGFINCMVTNASMITEENINTFFEFLDEVTFSIDFVDDSENEKYGRGSNYYAHVKEVIQLVNKKYPNCIVKINTVIMRQNVNQIDQIFNEIKQFKIAKWKLLQFSPLRGSAIINENEFSVEDVIYDNVAKKVQNFKSDFEINVHDFEHVKNSHVVISPAR